MIIGDIVKLKAVDDTNTYDNAICQILQIFDDKLLVRVLKHTPKTDNTDIVVKNDLYNCTLLPKHKLKDHFLITGYIAETGNNYVKFLINQYDDILAKKAIYPIVITCHKDSIIKL